MLRYDDFEGHVAAHLQLVKGRGVAAALEVLERRLDDGTWSCAPQEWVELLRWVNQRAAGEDRVDTLARAFLDGVTAREGVDEGSAAALKDLVAWALYVDKSDILEPLRTWVEQRSPGDTSLVADLLERASAHDLDPGSPFAAFGDWLLRRGVAELRSPGRMGLLKNLMLTATTPSTLAVCVRAVTRTSGRLQLGMRDHERGPDFWGRLERFDPSGPDETEVLSLIARLGASKDLGNLLPDPDRHPRCSRLLVRAFALGHGGVAGDRVAEIALTTGPVDLSGVPLNRLRKIVLEIRSGRGPFHLETLAADWARALAKAMIGRRGLHALDRETKTALHILGGWPGPAEGVVDALRDTSPPDLVRRILDEDLGAHHRVAAALAALDACDAVQERERVVPTAFHHVLERLLNTPVKPAYGVTVDNLFGSATTARFEALENEDLVRLDGPVLVVHDDYPSILASSGRPDVEQHALLAIFVVHELVHHQQGIGQKQAVGLLRDTGAESDLMRLDLSADHAAVLIVHAAFQEWDLLWLKDLQGRSILDFPIEPHHPFGSRMRKTTRLVGLRLDLLTRRRRPELGVGEGYVYGAFGPSGGPFFVLTSGPPDTVLVEGEVSPEDVRTMLTVLHAPSEDNLGDPIARLDLVLERVLS